MITLEVCCADIESVRAAIEGGAHRIELCSALEVGGLTPSAGLIDEASVLCDKAGVDLHVLVRPRPGDYLYSRHELAAMERDIELAAMRNVKAVVTGALSRDGDIDREATLRLSSRAREHGAGVTFHRAFDLCRNPFDALRVIADMGISRILTSGQAPSASEGAPLIAELVGRAPAGLTILAGAGITSANVAQLIAATGVTEVHASAKRRVASAMTYRHEGISMGASGADEYSRFVTDPAEVAAIIASCR